MLKILAATLLGVAPFSAAAQSSDYDPGSIRPDTPPKFRILRGDALERIDIIRVPVSEPIPLIIGQYWDCRMVNAGGPFADIPIETCRLELVVCNDAGDFCTSVP